MRFNLDDTTDATITYGRFEGKRFSWICKHKHSYITWARTQIPKCGTEIFRLVQFADNISINQMTTMQHRLEQIQRFEEKWAPLRQQHLNWMLERKNKRISIRDKKGSGFKLSEYGFI